MTIYPAIDIIDGKVVRLYKGGYDTVKNYDLTVEEAAKSFLNSGAKFLHAVDLDGAKAGRAVNLAAVEKIISSGLNVEIGGGIRGQSQIETYLNAGAMRVILGTVAVRDFKFTCEMAKKYPQQIAVGIDALNQKVAVSGWEEITEIDSVEFCKRLFDNGIDYVIYTDISRDGTLAGTNLEIYSKLKEIKGLKICASGGISSLDEIRTLSQMGVDGAILGKALYEGKLNLTEAIEVAKES